MKFVEGLLLVALVGVLGCGDDSASTSASGAGGEDAAGSTGATGDASGTGGAASGSGTGSAMAQVGDVEVTVAYGGTQTGTLNVAVVTSFPPSGPPVAFKQVENPTFPATVTLNDLEVGKDLYIAAVLDIGSNNLTMPGPEDLQTVTMPAVRASADSILEVDLTLADPQN